MADSRRLIKVFLASPGDLAEERQVAKAVVTDFNDLWAEEFGYQVELVGWEDTVSVFGRPQAIINRELDRCDLFIGILWRRWGTPPDTDGEYSSGFEEEYFRSQQRRLDNGQPEISLFFKQIDPELLRDPGKDLEKVLSFKDALISEKRILFENFSDLREFEKKIMRCICSFIKNLRAEERTTEAGEMQVSSNEGDAQRQNSGVITPLSTAGATFLRDFVAKTEGRTGKAVEPVDIARFRLLTTIVGAHGNDEVYLGSHDANLIFLKGGEFTLGNTELFGLVRTGLQHFPTQNVPLWRWVKEVKASPSVLPLYTVGPPVHLQVNSFAAMRLILESIPEIEGWNRGRFLASWFHETTPVQVKLAALRYLADCGNSSDLVEIRGEIERKDNQSLAAAADAFIWISLRESRENAFAALHELQPSIVHNRLIEALFKNPATLGTEMILKDISHQCPAVRREVVRLLCERSALPTELVEKLLSDTEAEVRYSALTYLLDHGQKFTEEGAKKILVKPKLSGFGWGLGLLSGGADPDGEVCFKRYQKQRLMVLNDRELESFAEKNSMADSDAYFVLAERHFKRFGDSLRKSIDNGYKDEFKEWLSQFEGNSEVHSRAKSLEESVRRDLNRKALDILCKKADHVDRDRIRELLRAGGVDYDSDDILYLGKHGEWEDIQLIIDLVTRQKGERSLLSGINIDEAKGKLAARAIYSLGRERLADLLMLKMPSQILVLLIIEISDRSFQQLTDSLVMSLWYSDDEAVRKFGTLKAIKFFSRARLEKLLQLYISGYISGTNSVYYNVLHWLDFGISVSRQQAQGAAQRVLDGAWTH